MGRSFWDGKDMGRIAAEGGGRVAEGDDMQHVADIMADVFFWAHVSDARKFC